MAPGKSWVGGGTCILVIVSSWVAQSEYKQSSSQDENWNKPFLNILLRNVLAYTPYGPLGLWLHHYAKKKSKVVIADASRGDGGAIVNVQASTTAMVRDRAYWKRYAVIVAYCQVVMFVIGYTWYLSLSHTTTAVNATVYNSNPVVLFLFSVKYLGERVTRRKLAGVGTLRFAQNKSRVVALLRSIARRRLSAHAYDAHFQSIIQTLSLSLCSLQSDRRRAHRHLVHVSSKGRAQRQRRRRRRRARRRRRRQQR
jgi:hypothetical protein